MSKFEDLHLELELKANNFRSEPTDENGNKIIEEIVKMIKDNASILVDGVPSEVNPSVITPSGYYAQDNRFYVHIFSSKVSFEASTATNPLFTHMKGLWEFVEENKQIGGFSLNHTKETGSILITREDIIPYL
jgi:hypothetical protein